MKLAPLLPSQALDLAYRRQKTARADLNAFEQARLRLLAELDATKDEPDMVQPLSRFLGAVGLGGYYLNSHGKRDLVLRTGPAPTNPFGVLFELKHRENPGEMVRPDDFNRKALHELLYYFQERTAEQQFDALPAEPGRVPGRHPTPIMQSAAKAPDSPTNRWGRGLRCA